MCSRIRCLLYGRDSIPSPNLRRSNGRGEQKKRKEKSFILKMLRSRSPVVETEEKDCEKQIRNHGRAHGWIHINFGGRVFFPLPLYTRDLHEPSLAIEEHLSGSPPSFHGHLAFLLFGFGGCVQPTPPQLVLATTCQLLSLKFSDHFVPGLRRLLKILK